MQDGVLVKQAVPARQPPAQIRISGLSKSFASGEQRIDCLAGIELEIGRGEFVCLLGPSGCGKSTLLNIVAGFLQPTAGCVSVDDAPIAGPSPERIMVFQDYALFPWMSVAHNIAFGLELKRLPKAEIAARVDEWLRMLRLQEFARRFPKDLSGGMHQRVAIARALAVDPPILLMDEPFGALDALTRRSLQDELLRIWAQLAKTVLFVTHSIEEAIRLADRIVVLTHRPGRIKQEVRIADERPRDLTAARFGAIKLQLTELVMEEQDRFLLDELSGHAAIVERSRDPGQ
jgi:NitT/TauT family transport system ATP-binding protein